jgi:hypothetical protein
MSTYIELCNQVNNTIGLQGSIADVTAPRGIQKNITDAVSSAWVDIQTMREDWTFMNAEISSFMTVEDKVVYTPVEVFGSTVAAANLSVYKTKRGFFRNQVMLSYLPWEDLPFADNTQKAPPMWYSIDPGTNNLHFQRPDDAHNIVIRYRRAPQILSENTDTPNIPEQFQRAIVYKAIQKVATYLGNAGLYQNYSVEGNLAVGQMLRNYIRARRVHSRNFLI